jgi:Divergent InlB B-repeat domain/Right handed beta helix region
MAPPASAPTPTNTTTLTLTVSGAGSVSFSDGSVCSASCTKPFNTGTSVSLIAQATSGHSFTGWGGACSGTAACTVTMNAAKSVSANFTATVVTPPTGGYFWPVWTADPVTVSPSTTGNTYYVDARFGNDNNDGKTVASALASVKKSLSKITAGDTVLIRAGFYREGINLTGAPSGAAGKPITFGSYGDGEVILDGSAKVSGWTQVSGSIWRAPVTFTPIAVVLNDVPLKQTPDGVAAVTAGSGKWHYDDATKIITADTGNANPNTADVVVPNNVGDQTHVYFYGGEHYTFKGLTIRGSGSNGIWGYGSNITVERCNIKFNGKAAVSFLPFQGKTSSDNAVLYTHAYQNVLLNWPRGNNGFATSGGGWAGAVVWSGNLRPLARGNIVHMNGGEGIITYGTQAGSVSGSALFEQNVVYDNWSVNMYFDNSPNNVARNNIIFNHPVDTSIWLRNTNVYPWNEMYKFSVCLMLADEENSSDSTNNHASLNGSQVYNNLIAGCRIGIRDYSEGTANSIKYHGLKNTLIANNTIILPKDPLPNTNTMGIFLQDNTSPSGVNRNVNSYIQNNIIYGFGNAPLIWIENQNALSGITVSNNVYYSAYATPFRIGSSAVQNVNFGSWQSLTGSDAASLFQDPLLVDATGFQAPGITPYDAANAGLTNASPARTAGKPQSAYSNNLPGLPRQVWASGAY